MKIRELRQKIEEQRNKNIELYGMFEYKMHEENMQTIIDEWRLGSKKLKQMLVELQELELKNPQKDSSKDNSKTFVNGFGEEGYMNTVKATDVKRGDVLKLWFGTHTVTGIKRYEGKLNFILNILVFDDGNEMGNERHVEYEAVYISPRIKEAEMTD